MQAWLRPSIPHPPPSIHPHHVWRACLAYLRDMKQSCWCVQWGQAAIMPHHGGIRPPAVCGLERLSESKKGEGACCCMPRPDCLPLSLASPALRPAPACHDGGEDGLRLGDVGWSRGWWLECHKRIRMQSSMFVRGACPGFRSSRK